MKQEQLDAIKECVSKATPWPWEIAYNRENVVDIWFDGEDNGHAEIYDNSFGNAPYNAKFIANARQDIPALVAEVERLQNRCELYELAKRNDKKTIEQISKFNEQLTTDLFKRMDHNGKLAKQNSDAVKEIEQLRKALEKIMEVEAPIMEGWETPAYKIARQALGGEAYE